MATEKIIQFPNSVLEMPTTFFELDDKENISKTIHLLLEAYEKLPNTKVGLAANQIGISKSMALILGEPFMNLEFKSANQIDIATEGCFSVENASKIVSVSRPKYGWAKWVNPITFEVCEEKLTGFKARVFQHELDHLNGKSCLL